MTPTPPPTDPATELTSRLGVANVLAILSDLVLSDPDALVAVLTAADLDPTQRWDTLRASVAGGWPVRVDDVIETLGLAGCATAPRPWVDYLWTRASVAALTAVAAPLAATLLDLTPPAPSNGHADTPSAPAAEPAPSCPSTRRAHE